LAHRDNSVRWHHESHPELKAEDWSLRHYTGRTRRDVDSPGRWGRREPSTSLRPMSATGGCGIPRAHRPLVMW